MADEPRLLPCQSEYDDAHDPLGGPDTHVYDPAPVLSEDHGSREVTPEDRATAIKRELINSTSNVHITPGMRRALRKRPWLRRWLNGGHRG